MVHSIGYFKASNTEARAAPDQNDKFGFSVALSSDGRTLAVGAPDEDSDGSDPKNNAAPNSGAVYVFTRTSTAQPWSQSQQAYLKELTPTPNDNFGSSVALSANGDTLAVGEPGKDDSAGKAYVFRRDGSGSWALIGAGVQAHNPGAHDQFGASVALSGDGNTLAVGAPGEAALIRNVYNVPDDPLPPDNNVAPSSGAVYVFGMPVVGLPFLEQAYVKASNTARDDLFGHAVALSADGTTLAVGAHAADDILQNEGAVYVFTRVLTPGAHWGDQKYLKASDPKQSDYFGWSLSLSVDGNAIAVGAPGTLSGTGAAYAFMRTSGQWSPPVALPTSNLDAVDQFGSSVALSANGNTLAVSAYGEDSNATGVGGDQTNNDAPSAGAVYLY
jgi:hypothetical protein